MATEILTHFPKSFSITNLPGELTTKTSDHLAADEEISVVDSLDKTTQSKSSYAVTLPVVGYKNKITVGSKESVARKRSKYKKQKKLMLQRSVSLDYTPMGKDHNKEQHGWLKKTNDGCDSDGSNCTQVNDSNNRLSIRKSFKMFRSTPTYTDSFFEKKHEFKRRPCKSKIERAKEYRCKSFDIRHPKEFVYQKKYTSLINPKINFAKSTEILQLQNSFDRNSQETIYDSAQERDRTNSIETSNLPIASLNLPKNAISQLREPESLSLKMNEHTIRDSVNTLKIGDVVISFPSNSQLILTKKKIVQLKTAEVVFNCSFDYTT